MEHDKLRSDEIGIEKYLVCVVAEYHEYRGRDKQYDYDCKENNKLFH